MVPGWQTERRGQKDEMTEDATPGSLLTLDDR